ncbi:MULTISPECIES: hypothetical protein [Reichenbachiella]|uniref:hypothetical protein n=1 Tax=Reichenbachiella TaxID=156993 RepID=UPI000E6C9F89|nr:MULTISPECIES: hypothetical protein [Reichenbachiella]MBU2914717.1 hypothetical protein [Reichenbachiella agariperforans]RJE71637.1 hypothetical protein BGP76_05985 [Reichenbachiella sp. MSK19-1]
MKPIIYLPLFLLTLFSCRPAQKSDQSTFQEVVKQHLGDDFQTFPNQDETYILVFSEEDREGLLMTTFLVWDKESEAILYQRTVKDGYVKWLNADEIVYKDTPGIIEASNPNFTYKYDLKKKVKTTYNPNNNE